MSVLNTSGVSGSLDVSSVSSGNLDGMDKATRLMVLCYTMLNLLDDRMQGQMDVIQARNQRAAELKGVVADMNAALAKFPPDADSNATITIKSGNADEANAVKTLQTTLQNAGVSGLDNLISSDGKIKKGDLDAAVSKVTGMMDSDTTIQQLDMFTLQSVFSKRNETFELMSNSLKKSQDTKSTLVRNF